MADDGDQAPETRGVRRAAQTASLSSSASPRSPLMVETALDISSFTYTSCYCEENVYMLCKNLCRVGAADPMGADLFVVFISNEEKMVPLWHQKASKRDDGLVLWDYHVICIQVKNPHEFQCIDSLTRTQRRRGEVLDKVWDLDSDLPFPSPLHVYFSEAIQSISPLVITRLFRVVHAPIFLRCFASDRSHMKDALGNWLALPPAYEPITSQDGTTNNLDDYIQMREADVLTNPQDLVQGVFSNQYGVVVNEAMLEPLFSQIHQ